MKRKHSPPPATVDSPPPGTEDSPPPGTVDSKDVLAYILSPPGSASKEIEDTIDSILSQPMPEMMDLSLLDQEPTDKTVQDLLEWFGTLFVSETIQERPSGRRISPPAVLFPWAKNNLGTRLHTLDYILYHLNMTTISANFECKSCGDFQNIEYNIVEKFMAITSFIESEGPAMGGVAVTVWRSPILPYCLMCNNKRRSLEQVLNEDSRFINWLFLFMAGMIGCCKVRNLKEFCEQNRISHYKERKERLLYLVYISICKQLDPQGNYDL